MICSHCPGLNQNQDKVMKKVEIEKAEKPFLAVASYAKDLFSASVPGGVAGKGVEFGMGAILAKTALKRLPVPFNLIAPVIVEKVILKHGAEEGREILLKGLRWIKKVTDDTPEHARITKANVNL